MSFHELFIAVDIKMVGTARFELATSRTPSVRATRLRYVPTKKKTDWQANHAYVSFRPKREICF